MYVIINCIKIIHLLFLISYVLSKYVRTYVQATCSGGVHRIRLEGILHIVDRKQKLDDRVKKIQHQKQQLLYQNQDKENISDQIRENSNENEKDAKFEMSCFRKNVLEEDSSLQCLRNIMNILQET